MRGSLLSNTFDGQDDFDAAYEGTPEWDIGEPQPAVVALDKAGQVGGAVLDVGCGTGEHALYFARRGHSVLGVDIAARAIEKARAKADARGLRAEFIVWDAFELDLLGRVFDTVIDYGLLHHFNYAQRPRYAASVAAVVPPGGRFHVLCLRAGHHSPALPQGLTRGEMEAAFREGWRIDSMRESWIGTSANPKGVEAWLATLSRLNRQSRRV
ncbi:MAG: class I SAM-dependent methyltransferase [Chloroflexi bacterium]|nr:class I SAM-dependent methyltransferase [Chloroflexota bacterium]